MRSIVRKAQRADRKPARLIPKKTGASRPGLKVVTDRLAWMAADRADEHDSLVFSGRHPMNDPSIWEDFEEDRILAKKRKRR
jgi:hypothetical protein